MKNALNALLSMLLTTTVTFAAPAIQSWHRADGTPVLFYPAPNIPMLDVVVAFHAGSAYDGMHWGLSTLTTTLLNQGHQGLSANEVAEAWADVGAQFSAENTRDAIILSLRSLSEPKARDHALQTFSNMLGFADFADVAFEREKNQQLLRIKQIQESPDAVATDLFYQTLYSKDHPYAHPRDGNTETVQPITRAQVVQFYQHFFVRQNAVIILVGAIDTQTAHRISDTLLKNRPIGARAATIADAKPLDQEVNVVVPFASTQHVLRVGHLGISMDDPDYFALLVGNYTLGGGGLVSQLSEQLREKRGLTYDVSSQFIPLPAKGPFLIALSTKHHQNQMADDLIRRILDDFIANGPTATELTAAQNYLCGSFPLSMASNQSMAHLLLNLGLYDLPTSFVDTYTQRIKAVTTAAIKNAFQRHINSHHLVNVQVGPA